MTLLEVRDLAVDFRGHVVLDGVDLDVCAGEVVVVLGGSGSGKSTLLRALLGLVPAPGRTTASQFVLRVDGQEIDLGRGRDWPAVRGAWVGMVFQDPLLALTPLRRVESLVAEVACDRDRVEPLLVESGFADPAPVAMRRAYELSGGMAQRVGLALAVAGGPRLLLADEPTTALDGPARDELCRRLRQRADDGAGILLVTHDVSVAAAVADRVVVLDAEKVLESGSPAAVLGSPRSPAAKRLVSNVPWALPQRVQPAAAAGGDGAVRVRGLAKAFPGTGPVLDGVDLDVADGEVVGVIGHSGDGKTTLLRCLLGLERPDAGTMRLAGMDPHERGWAAVRRAVQLVPQDPRGSLNPWRTAAQLVADPLRFHGIGTRAVRRRRAVELLEQVGLAGFEQRRPNELSSGQCQRVAIARALALEPRVLVADEPASALDVTLQADVLALLSALVAEQGMGALVVSHDLHVLERLCDRIAVLAEGRIVEDIPVDQLRAQARHPRTRALLAAYPTDPLAVAAG